MNLMGQSTISLYACFVIFTLQEKYFVSADLLLFQASLWPSIPLVVSQATVGTAMGLTTSIQMIGIGISNLVVGQILGKNDKSVHL